MKVASFTDAWIETVKSGWLREWKEVASFTDAWIETHAELLETAAINVASFTDAWIETYIPDICVFRDLSRIFYRCVD